MTGEELRRIIFHAPLTLGDELMHMFLSVFPLSDTDRQAFRIAPPCTMSDMVLARLGLRDDEAVRKQFYERCLKAGTPGSKAMAGEMLATHFHSLLVAGGVWELFRFEGTLEGNPNARTRTYIAPNRSCNRMLSANGTMQIVDWSPTPETFLSPSRFGTYAHPRRVDAFYILESGHALLFQTPGTAAPHGFTGEAVRWFAERGISKFTYVYVTPDFTAAAP